MDDKGCLCIATDCASSDFPMHDSCSDDFDLDDRLVEDFDAHAQPADDPEPEVVAEHSEPAPPTIDHEETAVPQDADLTEAAVPKAETPAESAPDDAAANAAAEAADQHARCIIEALLFSSESPLSAAKLAEMVDGYTPSKIRKHIDALNVKYAAAGLTFRIEPIARGYQMMTLPEYHEHLNKLNAHRQETRLSGAALETLSIIAYKQPIIRADVEAIRGVASGEVVSRLREMGLVRILGRADIVGRPLLYGTTKKFLDVFGLADLDDLPSMEALQVKPNAQTVAKQATKTREQVEPIQPPAIPDLPPRAAAVGS